MGEPTIAMPEKFVVSGKVTKVRTDLGLVFGMGIICKEDGDPYFDLQGQHIPEDEMLRAATDFAKSTRNVDVMHDEEVVGTAVFLWPLTAEIAKAFEIETPRTGLLVGIAPEPKVLKRFQSGELRAFSIGGVHGTLEPEDDE